MRRSSLFLLLVIEVLALFVFENMRALFATLEAREREGIAAVAELQADLYVLRYAQALPSELHGFAAVERLARGENGRQVVIEEGEPLLEVRRSLPDGSGLLFRRPLRSPQLGIQLLRARLHARRHIRAVSGDQGAQHFAAEPSCRHEW